MTPKTCEVCGDIIDDLAGFITLENIHLLCDTCQPIVAQIMESTFQACKPSFRYTVEDVAKMKGEQPSTN